MENSVPLKFCSLEKHKNDFLAENEVTWLTANNSYNETLHFFMVDKIMKREKRTKFLIKRLSISYNKSHSFPVSAWTIWQQTAGYKSGTTLQTQQKHQRKSQNDPEKMTLLAL